MHILNRFRMAHARIKTCGLASWVRHENGECCLVGGLMTDAEIRAFYGADIDESVRCVAAWNMERTHHDLFAALTDAVRTLGFSRVQHAQLFSDASTQHDVLGILAQGVGFLTEQAGTPRVEVKEIA